MNAKATQLIWLTGATILLTLAFSQFYLHFTPENTDRWLGTALINSAFGLFVIINLLRIDRMEVLSRPPLWSWLPMLAILSGTLLLGLATKGIDESPVSYPPLAWVFWVPIVEELVFRVGVGGAFRRIGGVVWGSWFSALTFAWVHTHPSVTDLMELNVGLPLGPFLMGLISEFLYIKTQRIWPSIGFHGACNFSVFLFIMLDSKWLDRLEVLYG
jgi:membrane protease YdiL (CAAX protease family)